MLGFRVCGLGYRAMCFDTEVFFRLHKVKELLLGFLLRVALRVPLRVL